MLEAHEQPELPIEKQINTVVQSKIPPRKSIPPFEALRAFDAVARLGGVRKAAQELHRDHAVVSRHLRALEDWTGTKLIERTPAGAMLTEEGKQYHQRIAGAIDNIAEATIDLIKRNQQNSLNAWCMPGFALHWLVNHLSSFEKANPSLDIELRSTHEEPDFSRQEADVDIRHVPLFGPEKDLPPNVRSIEIASPAIIPVASPDYLASHDPIEHPRDLLKHQLLNEEDFDNWRIWFAQYELFDEAEFSGPRLWDGHMTLAAARRGRGIALTNPLVAADDLAQQKLVEVGKHNDNFKCVKLWSYWFVARCDRWHSPPVKYFREWLISKVAKELPVE